MIKLNNMDVIYSINKKYRVNLERDEIQYILDFTLLWNLFELEFFYDNCNKTSIKNKVENYWRNLDKLLIDKTFEYFKNRYISDWVWNEKTKYLNPKNISHKREIIDNLINDSHKLFTIIFIIYRYRNNLFHWNKRIELIDWQDKNFKVTNRFLEYLLFENK